MNTTYIYTFGYRIEEVELCQLEMRSLFGKHSETGVLISDICIDADRSPFMRERLEVLYEGNTLDSIYEQVRQIKLNDQTFKVIFMKMNDLSAVDKIEYDGQRSIERKLGMIIEGEADVRQPDQIFGIIT
ncbi:MAG TPA: RNA methyltransferase, partial [Candidatus Paenibacillus intestinavium]|nr:RNA methyltransferase [Candidatus Paenibacillus intestinavium]